MIYFKACARCGGDVHLDGDSTYPSFRCFQCSYDYLVNRPVEATTDAPAGSQSENVQKTATG